MKFLRKRNLPEISTGPTKRTDQGAHRSRLMFAARVVQVIAGKGWAPVSEVARVVVADIDGPLAEAVAAELRSQGAEALPIHCDVSVETDVKAMVAAAVAAFGRLDAAFNNAGVQSPAIETADADSHEFDRHIAINLKGVWMCMK